MLVKISTNKQHWIKGLIVGFNPITERFLVADPERGNILGYTFMADLDENIIPRNELERIKAEQRSIAIGALSNLRSQFSV